MFLEIREEFRISYTSIRTMESISTSRLSTLDVLSLGLQSSDVESIPNTPFSANV